MSTILMFALAEHPQMKIFSDMAVFAWLVSHATGLATKYQVAVGGLTAFQRI